MHSQYYRNRSGPHSIHDARQYAWALLVFGPGAPAPRQRPHPGLLPDIPDAVTVVRPSIFSRLAGLFRQGGSRETPDATASGEPAELAGNARLPEAGEGTTPDGKTGAQTEADGKLAA